MAGEMAACILLLALLVASMFVTPSGMYGPARMILKQARVHALTQPLSTSPPPFHQAIEEGGVHWSKRVMVTNVVRTDLWNNSTEDEAETAVGAPQLDAALPLPEPSSLSLPTPPQDPVPSGQVRGEAAGSSAAALSSSAPARPSQGTTAVGGRCGSSNRVCYRHGVVCLMGPALEAVADKLNGQVPEHAQKMRWV